MNFRQHVKTILMYYTADSVKAEIDAKTKNILTINGDPQCPQSTAWLEHANMPCPNNGNPISCLNVLNEDRKCKQTVYVYPHGEESFWLF